MLEREIKRVNNGQSKAVESAKYIIETGVKEYISIQKNKFVR